MIPSASPRRPRSLGFTRTELALVLLMTGVMATVGRSAYATYAVRAQVAAGMLSSANLRAAIENVYASDRGPPANLRDVPQPLGEWRPPSALVATWGVVYGRIDMTFGGEADPAIAGRTLSLTPYETADLEIVWVCGNRIPGAGLKPLGFSAGGPQAAQIATTIDGRYLPPGCR